VAQRRVEMPAAESKSFMCSCGKYGPGNQYGVATHRSKTKCGGKLLILLDEPDAPEPAAAPGPEGAAPAPPPDLVIVDGKPETGRVVEPKPGAPTAFKQQVETTAQLRVYYDYFHVALKYEGTYDRWLEEMANLALTELFGFELIMQVRRNIAAAV
jgi:hypothetical protein